MSDSSLLAGGQPEFWKTLKDPEQLYYPGPQRAYPDMKDLSIDHSSGRPWNRYYVRKLTNVRFVAEAGNQVLLYDETDIYGHVFTLFIEDQPDLETVLLCKRAGTQLYAIGSAGRNDGGWPFP